MSEEERLAEFTSQALRGPKAGVYQQILAQKIIQATRTPDPLKKIAFTCEAALLSQLKDEKEKELIEVALSVCRSFQDVTPRDKYGRLTIPWGFVHNEENYNRFIKPWNVKGFSYGILGTWEAQRMFPKLHRIFNRTYYEEERDAIEDIVDDYQNKVHDAIKEMPKHEQFFETSHAITKEGYESIKGEFISWVLPQLLEVSVSIMSGIDPDVYTKTFSIMAGKDGEKTEDEG